MKIFGLVLRFELTVQFRVDIRSRANSGLCLLLRLNMLLLFLFIIESLNIQLVLEQLVLIEVICLLPLFDLGHVLLGSPAYFPSGSYFIRAGSGKGLRFLRGCFFLWSYSRDLRGTPVGDLARPLSHLIVRFISTRA